MHDVPCDARFELFPRCLEHFVVFYTSVLGFAVSTQRDGYVAVQRGSVRIGASLTADAVSQRARRPPTGVELVLEVADLEAEEAAVLGAGWPLEEPIQLRPWGLRDFRILDPDGYYIRFTTRRT
jgi:lactoylglutathione lyase